MGQNWKPTTENTICLSQWLQEEEGKELRKNLGDAVTGLDDWI